ncbi:uncharacterized protein cd44b isoform X1 [Scyliorhinus torazame]|uniref:uncharacterized protein cd44b isoform X1 n=2 Tax=Scyliorhinus torazame TaxID=75743 RepID=UPI003B58D8BF
MCHRLFIGALGAILAANFLCVQDVNAECRHHGVFQEESGGRYQLDFKAAAELCQSLGTTLATLEQLTRAQRAGYETCRYGWIQGPLIAIPRVNAHPHCAKNNSGVYTIYKLETKTFDVFCFNATEYENCGSQISSSTLSPAEPAITRTNIIPNISGKSMISSLQITREYPLVTSAKSHDIATGIAMVAESETATRSPGSAESSPHNSSESDIHSTAPSSVGNSGLPEKQPTRPESRVTPGITVKLDPLSITLGYAVNSLRKTTLAMRASQSAGDMTPHIGPRRIIPLIIKNQVTEAKPEHHSDTDLTTRGSITQPPPSIVISGNIPGINATIGSNKVSVDYSDFPPTLKGSSMLQTNTESERENMSGVTSTWSNTQEPTIFERRDGTSAIPPTPNPTELPAEITTRPGIFIPKSPLDHRTFKKPDIGTNRTVTESPELIVERGSTPELLSSESAKIHLDLMTATVFETKWVPFKASSPDPSGLTVESGSTSEILSSEPTETLSEFSTVLGDNKRFSISASPEPTILFVESGSTPEILKSEPKGLVEGFSPDFTVTTDVARIPTRQQTTPGLREKSDLPARTTLQDVVIEQTPSKGLPIYLSTAVMSSAIPDRFTSPLFNSPKVPLVPINANDKREIHPLTTSSKQSTGQLRLPIYLSTAAMSSSAIPDRLTSPLFHSPKMPLVPINANDKREIHPLTTSSKQSTGQLLKLTTPGSANTTRIYSTSDFGWAATSRTTNNQITQTLLLASGRPEYAEPTGTETDLIILDDVPSRKLQPTTTAVGEKPPEVSLDWLIVVGIIALLLIVIGGLLIAYRKRLCGRKKSLAITRPREDNTAIMENGNRRDLVEECGLKADIKRSDEWIQLMSKDDVEVVSESAEAARLMSGEESGEPSNREMMPATQEEGNKS